MPAFNPAPAVPATAGLNPPASTQAVAERGLRSSRYSALKHVSCDYQGGVLVLRGCLPSYYLKQIAQEVVAHQFDQVERLENRIEVVRPLPAEAGADAENAPAMRPPAVG